MRVIKSVKQNYEPSQELLVLLEDFRKMVNDCVRLGLDKNITSLKALSCETYHALSKYNVPSYYRLTAISKATGILRNYRKAIRKNSKTKKPYADKLMLTDCYGFRIKDDLLRLPLGNKRYVFIPLNAHTQAVISGYTVRSVALTTRILSIAFSKETAEIDLAGLIGIDRNLDNVTTTSSNGKVRQFDLSEATHIKAKYKEIKSHFTRNDVRIRRRIFGKYGVKQRNKANQHLHHVSKEIVEQAKSQKFGIVMEKLTGIRKLYRRGNFQGEGFRARMNLWSFYELQRQIEYKAKWEGVPVIYVLPQKTSSICAKCGSRIIECIGRKVYCPVCETVADRDINAAKNILTGGLRFRPIGQPIEAMVSVKR